MQVASVVVEPKTGKIIALTGGKDCLKSQFNRAVDSKDKLVRNQTISLLCRLRKWAYFFNYLLSEPTIFTFGNNNSYAPSNYGKYYPNKPISMAAAIAYSDNIYAVKTHLFLGEDVLVRTMKRVGVKEN